MWTCSRGALALDVVLEVVDGEADAAADADGCELVVPDQLVDGRPADGEELCRSRDGDEQRRPWRVGVFRWTSVDVGDRPRRHQRNGRDSAAGAAVSTNYLLSADSGP